MGLLNQFFKNSKSYLVLKPTDAHVAVDGLKSSSKRVLHRGTLLTYIGGTSSVSGFSFYKSQGINAPIKIHNEFRQSKSVTKVVAMRALEGGVLDCGTPFKMGQLFYLLGVKSGIVKFLSPISNRLLVYSDNPETFGCRFDLLSPPQLELMKQDMIFKTNMHTDFINFHFGKETSSSRFTGY